MLDQTNREIKDTVNAEKCAVKDTVNMGKCTDKDTANTESSQLNQCEKKDIPDLSVIRGNLDVLDRKIVELYEERMVLAGQVAEYKIATGKKVFDKERELAKLASVKALTSNAFNGKGIEELFEQIMAISRKLQYQKITESMSKETYYKQLPFLALEELDMQAKVVFQGAAGSYSEAAMKQFFGKDVNCTNVATFRDAMQVLEEGLAKYAVLPIENSTAGVVNEIYDLLAEFEHYIVAEQVIKIEHCLLGAEGASLESIRTVYSHPQSLMQSEHFLREHASWEQISMKNNAFAAQMVAEEKNPTKAAIASEYAAQCYGLQILKKAVNDNQQNSTRFIVVSNQKTYLKNAGKISVCFEIPHESGSLYHILSHFIYNNLNMTKIESRPIEGKNWEYRFFIDFEGNLADAGVKNALCGLREEAMNLRVLGNY